MIERKNDWIATLLNAEGHPEITEQVLYANGITPDNTGIKDKDYYKSVPQIQEKFTKDGKFDETAYSQFYDSALRSYNSYSNDKFVDSLLDYFGTSRYDVSILSNPAQNVYKTGAVITNFYDRNRHSYGTGNVWEMGDANFSDREVAQANKVRDEYGNVLDWTPNDKGGLLKGLFRPTIVMASYDNDIYDDNGVLIHQKGELKLDENGDPYTEILGNRDSYGKDVVKYADTLTVEGTKLNDWDPFDSDGLNKSIGSTIAKTLFTMGPFFIPYVGPTLGVIAALGGIASALPTLSKAVDGFITGSDDDAFGRSMTTIENAMSRFGFSQSDAAKGKFLSLENISDIFSTSAGQLFSQRMIGKVPQLLAKLQQTGKINTKLGQQMSLGYMALTSANDTYGAFKEAGANDQVAGLGMLATIGGFWWLMNQAYFKDKLFEGGLLDEDQQLRRTFMDASRDINKDVYNSDLKQAVFKEGGFWDRLDKSKSKIPHALGASVKKVKEVAQRLPIGRAGGVENAFISRALNEGIEETMEEGMQDSIKALAKGLELIGLKVTENPDDTLDFGMTPEEMLQRYASSFVGGALGGATFEVFNQIDLFKNPELKKLYQMAPVRRMVYDLQDTENLDRYIRTIDKLYKNGKLGNKNLSATQYNLVEDPKDKNKGTRVYKQGDDNDNQNLAVRNLLLGVVHQVHDLLKENGLVRNSSLISMYALTNPTIQEEIKKSGLSIQEYWDKNRPDIIAGTLHDIGVLDTAVRQAKDIGQQIFNLKLKIRAFEDRSKQSLKLEGAELQDALNKDKDYQFFQDQLKALQQKYDDIVDGKNGDDYMGFAYMLLADSPLKYYTNIFGSTTKNGESKSITTIENFADVVFNVDYASLDDKSQATKEYIDEQFKDFMVGKEKAFWNIWQFHKNLEEKYADDITKANEFLKDHKIDPFHSAVTIGEHIVDLIKERDAALQKLNDIAKDPEEADDNEIIDLQKQILKNNAEINLLQPLNPTLHLNELFDLDKFHQIIDPEVTTDNILTFDSDELVQKAKQNVLDYYKYLKDHKIVTPTKEFLTDYLSKYLSKLGLQVNSPMIKNKIKAKWVKTSGDSKSFIKFVYGDTDVSTLPEDEFQEKINDARTEALGLFSSDTEINNFVTSLEDLLTLLQINPAQGLKKYKELQKKLDEKMNFDAFNALIDEDIKYDSKTLLDEMLFSKHTDTMNFVSGVIDTIDSLDVSPTFDILKDLSIKMTGGYNKIIDLLEQQRQNLGSGIENFQLNETMKKALDEAQMLLNVYTALIDSAQSNLNAKVNEYRRPLGKKPFAEISEETKNIIIKDIQYLQSQIDYLKTLGGANLEKRFIEQQQIMKNDTVKRIKFFVEPPKEYKPLVENLEKILDVKFADIWKGDFDIDSDEKFAEFDKNRIEFESELYKRFNSNNSDAQKVNIIQFIADQFKKDKTFITSNAGLLTSDDSSVTAYGMYRYLLLNLVTDSKQVASWYKTVMKDSPFVPFYSQELIIRDALANYLNRDLYNAGLKVVEQVKNESTEKFIKDCLVLKNFLFINGVPGAGKTAVIANTIKKIIRLIDGNDDTQFISLSMTETQANKLAESIEESNTGHTWAEFKQVNTTNAGEEYDGAEGHKLVKGFTSKLALSEISKNPKAKKYVIFFDEIQLLREPDVIKLHQIVDDANNNGYEVMIFGLGDLMQTSVSESMSKLKNSSELSITNTLFNSSFRLSASFRETNQGKSENTLAVASKLQTVMENIYNDKSYDISDANKATNNAFATKTELRWYDDGKAIYGDKFIKHSDIDRTLDKLKAYVGQHDSKSKNPEIAIVVETEDDKQAYALKINNDSRIGVYTKTEISGGEFDYVIIDSKLNEAPFMATKEFYTLMSRARNASFFVAEKTQTLNLYSNDEGTPSAANLLSSKDSENQKKIYDSFKEWRMKLFEGIPEVSTPEKPKKDEKVSNTGSSAASTFGSGNGTVNQKYNKADLPSEQEINDYIESAENDNDKQSLDNRKALESRKERSHSNEKATIKNRQSKETNDCDGEIFEEWLRSNNPAKLGLSILRNIDSEDSIEQYRDFLRHFSSFILTLASKEGDARETQIENIEDIVWTGAGNIGDTLSKMLISIKEALKNNKGYYYITSLDDNHSLMYYVFNIGDKVCAVPVTIVNGNISGVKYTTLKSEKVVDYAFVSSKGKYHLDPRDVAKGKVSVGSHYATVINKGRKEIEKPLYHQEGKSFALFGEFNKAIEERADSEAKDFLVFELDDDGKIVSYYQKDKKGNKDVNIDFKIRGIQRQLPINDFVKLCGDIQRENDTKSQEEREALDKSIAKTLGIKIYKRDLKLATQLGEDKENLTNRVRLLTGEARRTLVDAIHKVIGKHSILNNGISQFWFSEKFNKENSRKPIIKITYYTDNNKSNGIVIYLKKVGDKLVLCQADGTYWSGENINEENSFDVPSEKGTWVEFIKNIITSIKKLDSSGTNYSIIPNTLSDEDVFSKVSVDYYVEGQKDGKSFVYARYIEDLVNSFSPDQLTELQRNLEEDPEFVHGVYLNLQVENFLNVEDGEPSAEWGINTYGGDGIITSDDIYIFAPIYNLTSLLTEKGENVSIQVLDAPNRLKTENWIIDDPKYTKNGDEWKFSTGKVRVSKNWLLDSLTETSKQDIPAEGEMFSVDNINPTNKTICIWISSDRISKPLALKNNFTFDVLNNFTNNERTIAPAWDNNYNLVVENNQIYAENSKTKERIDIELIGENNSGFYYLVNDEYKFYKYEDGSADKILKGLFDSSSLSKIKRGFILGISEQGPIYIAIGNRGYEFRVLQNNNLTVASYDPSTNIISIGNTKINASEIENFERNLKDFQNNDKENIQKFKDDLVSKFKEYDLFTEDNVKYIIESNTIEDAIEAANDVLKANRYLFEDGNSRRVESENGKLKIVEQKDKTVILGNILLKRVEGLNNSESILSIEKINSENAPDSNNYLVTLQIKGKQEQRTYTLFKNDAGQWDAKIYNEIENDLNDALNDVVNIISEDDTAFIREYINDWGQGQTTEESDEEYDRIYEMLPDNIKEKLDAIFDKLMCLRRR